MVKFSAYDTADYLQSEEDSAAYLEAVLEEGDPRLLAAALGDIARARNFSEVARKSGISRQGLEKSLSGKVVPSMSTVMNVIKALGLQLHIAHKTAKAAH